MTYTTAIVLIGVALTGAAAGFVGCFAVLRRRAMAGDALAHATLPGVAVGFLLAGERDPRFLLAGAFAGALLGAAAVATIRRFTRVKEDAAIGIVLGVFYGGGVALIRLIQNRAAGGSKAGLDNFILGRAAGMTPADVYLVAGVAVACVAAVVLLYKEFQVLAFDREFARAAGWPVLGLDLAVTACVAATVAAALPAVGVVMTAALLVLPAVAARFWTDRLGRLLPLAALVGAGSAAGGVALSAGFARMPTGPVVILVGSAAVAASALFAPRRGVVARWRAHAAWARGASDRATLLALWDGGGGAANRPVPLSTVWGELAADPADGPRVVRRIERRGWAERAGDALLLTPAGRTTAARAADERDSAAGGPTEDAR